MASRKHRLATLATTALLTGVLGVPSTASSASRLTRAGAEAAARTDAVAATAIYGGDKVRATCRATARNVFRCQIQLLPAHSVPEIYEIATRPTVLKVGALILNAVIVAYLVWRLRRKE
ncbi:MAG: DUF2127 domain-containing protein [Actinobacteria bacterium]|nr:DUF2127 domain-containing protein [Actinomycetota bacterium]